MLEIFQLLPLHLRSHCVLCHSTEILKYLTSITFNCIGSLFATVRNNQHSGQKLLLVQFLQPRTVILCWWMVVNTVMFL